MSSHLLNGQTAGAVNFVPQANGVNPAHTDVNGVLQPMVPGDPNLVPMAPLVAPGGGLPAPNNAIGNPNPAMNLNQMPALSLSTLNSIPVNWLPKNPIYTQKAESDPSIEPNQTLYIRNLNDRVNTKVMENALRELFSAYPLLDVILMKSFWRRGQAWVIFSTIENAAKAMFEFNGFLLYGHAMHINYALEKSYLVSKMNGTYVPSDRKGVKMKPRRIRQRELLYYQSNPAMAPPSVNPMGMMPGVGLDHSMGGVPGFPPGNMVPEMPGFDGAGMAGYGAPDLMGGFPPFNAGMPNNMGPGFPAGGMPPTFPAPNMNSGVPPGGPDLERAVMLAHKKANELSYRTQNVVNKTLFVENLPENVTNLDVVNVFNKMPGFVEARVIIPRRVAFIDFDSDNSSSYALQGCTSPSRPFDKRPIN
ncbi:U1 snRNP protein [Theileria orientalis strain Shintoku]|uniref:U1 snRNP protein n=1 Tax=Theileria orientalis strain Shintoku TaxID=869250 RepID=J4DPZ7_THEOR|nr:U1 snRNP protein [Theileria orientalis strain Shintoku]BAM41574.1 U1 snRNP protein [Theileria orientalis strain Shintoku]|eukprot:XP_009691875.1 U1 snRNP protein [Theileria orientalis strain Shintoku]